MSVNLKPLGDRVLVEPVEEKEVKKGGIIIPDTAKEKPTEGLIIALGTGKTDDNGKKVPFEVKKGDSVLINKKFGSPTVTKDGVTVAKEIELEDPYENMGAQMVREVASNTSDAAGDGTTTATVLAEAIYREGLKFVTSGANPIGIQRGVMKAVETAVTHLDKIAKKVKDKDRKSVV